MKPHVKKGVGKVGTIRNAVVFFAVNYYCFTRLLSVVTPSWPLWANKLNPPRLSRKRTTAGFFVWGA